MLQVFGVLFIHLPFSGNVSMTLEVPGQINAGNDLKVQITLNKSDITSFARFQMELPPGITASNGYSANADFTFKDQKVRLIWLKVPKDEVITFNFTIHCNDHLKGNFNIGGIFSYIQDNEKKMVDLQPQQIAIVPSPNIDPGQIVDIGEYGKSMFSQSPVAITDVACIRQKPEWTESNHQYIVTLLLNKEKLKKFAKIEELIPKGYTAISVTSKEGIFTFRDNKAKFLWMNLPSEPFFTVSYKLIPMDESHIKQPLIKGTFSYIIDDKTQSIPVIEKEISLANLTPEMVKSILQAPAVLAGNVIPEKPEKGIVAIDEVKTQQKITANIQQPVVNKESVDIKRPVTIKEPVANKGKDTIKKVVFSNNKQKSREVAVSKVTAMEKSSELEPRNGVYFSVQLAAGHRQINVKRYFQKYKLDNTIYKENHEGWIKYSVGTFNVYKDARDYRVHIWNTTTIADAFVSAYNDGKRITVQEALMVTSQHWYQ
jgi:hypothetical protein